MCILQPQPTGLQDSRWESFTFLQRSSVYSTAPADWATGLSLGEFYLSAEKQCVFYSPSRLGYRTLVGRVLPFCREAVCILQPQPIGLQDSRWESFTFLQRSSVYSTAPADWATGLSLGEFYLSAEKQCVFYSPSRLGYRTLVGRVLPFCREAVCILQPQPIGPKCTREEFPIRVLKSFSGRTVFSKTSWLFLLSVYSHLKGEL